MTLVHTAISWWVQEAGLISSPWISTPTWPVDISSSSINGSLNPSSCEQEQEAEKAAWLAPTGVTLPLEDLSLPAISETLQVGGSPSSLYPTVTEAARQLLCITHAWERHPAGVGISSSPDPGLFVKLSYTWHVADQISTNLRPSSIPCYDSQWSRFIAGENASSCLRWTAAPSAVPMALVWSLVQCTIHYNLTNTIQLLTQTSELCSAISS